MKAGDRLTVAVNQGYREGHVLAVLGTEALIEYEMPEGSTALRYLHVPSEGLLRGGVSYNAVPDRWLAAIARQHVEHATHTWDGGLPWIGCPQQTRVQPAVEARLREMIARAERGEAL